MKITKTQLREIIREEIHSLKEAVKDPKLKVGQKIRFDKANKVFTLKKITHGNVGIPEDPAGTSYMFVGPGNAKEYFTKKTWNNAVKKGWLKKESINEGKWAVQHKKNKRYLSSKSLQDKTPHEFKSEKEAQNMLVGIDWRFRGNYKVVKLKESISEGSLDWEKDFKEYNKKELKVIQKFISMNDRGIEGVIKMSKKKDFKPFIQKLAKKGLGESINEGGQGVLDKDQADVLQAIVMMNKKKSPKAILKIAMKDRMLAKIPKQKLAKYIEEDLMMLNYM